MNITDIDEVKDILGCSALAAQHYLSIFGNDKSRAIQSVLSYGDDHSWWGHPWNSDTSRFEGVEEEKETDDGSRCNRMPRSDDISMSSDDNVSENQNLPSQMRVSRTLLPRVSYQAMSRSTVSSVLAI
mmetsp:Transcript_27741/g.61710  ORF Transcript_27741/g.61710 Transcript_27741/m.61710 type:complete len:128 (+) Transcript_27741:648-1031(+)